MTTVAFVGAGSVEFTADLLTDLSRWDAELPMVWRLHDVDADRLETAVAVARALVGARGLRAQVEAHPERRSALDGADAVVVTVMIGGLEATRADLTISAEAGLRQTIGDSLGVGGIFRGLRSAGFYRGLVDDVRALCPRAWILNYTNPMAINMGFVHAIAPELNVLGLCHSVHWTMETLAGIVGVPLAETTFRAAGVNHQSWVLDWRRGQEDLHPRLDAAIAADPQLSRRVRVDMYRRLGFFPTESSEHSAEYVPWYLKSAAEVERLRLQPGEYLGISEENAKEYARTREALARGEVPEFATEAVEYAPQVIAALGTGQGVEIYATVPNEGLIDGLPHGAPVEVPVVVDAHGAHPVAVGALPPVCAALNRRFLDVVDHTVRAAVSEDPALVRHAALLDPNTSACLTPDEVDTVLTRLTAAHRANLPAGLADARYGDARL